MSLSAHVNKQKLAYNVNLEKERAATGNKLQGPKLLLHTASFCLWILLNFHSTCHRLPATVDCLHGFCGHCPFMCCSCILDIMSVLLKWMPFSFSKTKWFNLTFNKDLDFRVPSNSKVNVHETCELVSRQLI